MGVRTGLGRWCRIPVSVYTGRDESLRHATWLELFFDLVFVVAVAELGGLLHHDLTLGGLVRFVGLFAVVWWIWLSVTYFSDTYRTDDPLSVLLVVASMFGVVFLSQTIESALDGGSLAFAAAVFLLRGFLTVSHLRARHLRAGLDAGTEQSLTYWMALEVLVTSVWGLSLLVPTPGRYGLWMASFGLSVAGMTTIYLSFESIMAPETSHCNERLGLFTILVLGETILAVGVGTSIVAFTPSVLLSSALGFAVVVAIWWLYFYRYDERIYDRMLHARTEHWSRLRPRAITHVYAHVLVHAGIVVTGIGIAVALEAVLAGHALPAGGRLALCVGPAIFLLGSGISRWVTAATLDRGTVAGRLAVVGLLGLLAVLGGALPTSALLALLALSLLGLVVLEGVSVRFEPVVAAEGEGA